MSIAAVILAAGMGTRMKSKRAKVLHELAGKPLIAYVVDQALAVGAERVVVIVGHQAESVKKYLSDTYGDKVKFALQKEQLGTAHAVLQAKRSLSGFDGNVLILFGDVPLLQVATIKKLIGKARRAKSPIGLLTALLANASDYGHIVRENGRIVRSVEHKDASKSEREIPEVNVGTYFVDKKFLFSGLAKVGSKNKQGEFYLPDLIAMAAENGEKVVSEFCEPWEMEGVNSRVQLSQMESKLGRIINTKHMQNGVSIIRPETVRISADARIARDTVIHPNVFIDGKTVIGEDCIIAQGAVITNAKIDAGARIEPYCVIADAEVGPNASVGPLGRLRPGAKLERGASIGNFTEVKNSILREGVKANHLSYIGDADIGQGTNVGAGTITCNYDGYNKFKTVIGKEVFIGSDTQLVSPVEIPDHVIIGAGTCLTKHVELQEGDLVVSRAEVKVRHGYHEKAKKEGLALKAAKKKAAQKKATKKKAAKKIGKSSK